MPSVSILDPYMKNFEACAILFGGSNAEMCSADVWLMD